MSAPTDPASTEPGQWANFSDARAAMETMSLEELRDTSGLEPPRLLPYGTPAVILGIVMGLASLGYLVIMPMAVLILIYGFVSLGMNRSRITQYREECYRRFVHRRAEEMRESSELDDQ